MVVHDLKERIVGRHPLRIECRDQLFEGQILMRLRPQRRFADLLQDIPQGTAAIQHAANDLRVHEKADDVFGFDPVTVGIGHADADVLLAGESVQQHIQRRQQHHEGRHAFPAAQRANVRGQFGWQHHMLARRPVPHACLTREIRGQLQYGLHLAHPGFPVFQLMFGLAGFQPLALPDGVILVLQRQWPERRGRTIGRPLT